MIDGPGAGVLHDQRRRPGPDVFGRARSDGHDSPASPSAAARPRPSRSANTTAPPVRRRRRHHQRRQPDRQQRHLHRQQRPLLRRCHLQLRRHPHRHQFDLHRQPGEPTAWALPSTTLLASTVNGVKATGTSNHLPAARSLAAALSRAVRSTTRSARLTVSTSTFSDNTAHRGRAALFKHTPLANIASSTFSGNTAFTGGGIANDLSGTMTLVNSTVADNYAGQNGGGINQVGVMTGSPTARSPTTSSRPAERAAESTPPPARRCSTTRSWPTTRPARARRRPPATSAARSPGHELTTIDWNRRIGRPPAGVNANIVGSTTPGLGTLANNGGPTETIALLAGSPAIDAGNNALAVDASGNPLLYDQRGMRLRTNRQRHRRHRGVSSAGSPPRSPSPPRPIQRCSASL